MLHCGGAYLAVPHQTQPLSPASQGPCQRRVLPPLRLRMPGMLEAADCTATPREGMASILHPPASKSWAVGQRCPGRDCLGSCNVQVHGLWVLETVWGGGGVRRSLVWLHAWRCLAIRGAARRRPQGAMLAFGSCTRRSKKEPPTVTVFCNGRKGKKLARSCVCSSGRVGYPRGASAAQGTVLGLLNVSIVLVLGVGDVHDGHQSLLGAKAALQPVTIHLGDDLQNIPFVEAQLSCLSGNVMAKSFHLTAGRRKVGLAHLRTLTPPRDHHRSRGERKTPPASLASQAPNCSPSSSPPADCGVVVDGCTSCITAPNHSLVHNYQGGQANCNR